MNLDEQARLEARHAEAARWADAALTAAGAVRDRKSVEQRLADLQVEAALAAQEQSFSDLKNAMAA